MSKPIRPKRVGEGGSNNSDGDVTHQPLVPSLSVQAHDDNPFDTTDAHEDNPFNNDKRSSYQGTNKKSGHNRDNSVDNPFATLSLSDAEDLEVDPLRDNDNLSAQRKGSVTLSVEGITQATSRSPTMSRRTTVDRLNRRTHSDEDSRSRSRSGSNRESSQNSPAMKDKNLLAANNPRTNATLSTRGSSSPHMRLLSRENSTDDGLRNNPRMSPMKFNPTQDFGNPFDDNSDRDDGSPAFGMSKFEYLELQIQRLTAENKALSAQLVLGGTACVDSTITSLWNGEPCRLDNHKSLPQKMALLDGALTAGDGEAINAVLDFLEHTLHEDLFWQMLDSRPVAIAHYSRLLSARGDWRPLSRFYTSRGQYKKAIDGILEEAFALPSALDRIVLLREATEIIEKHGDNSDVSLDWESKMIEQYMSLLVRQQPIEKHDSFLEEDGEDAFLNTYPRNGSLVGTSVAHTLHYCLFYHYLAPEDRLSSHKGIMKAFEISDRHYTWISVEARAQLQDWEAINVMFQPKTSSMGLFASKKSAVIQIPIGVENLIDLLHRYQAPLQVIRKFYSSIQDKQARYLAVVAGEQVDDAIDTWAEVRDISALKQYLVDIEGGKLGLNSRDISMYGDRIRRIIQ